MSRFALLTALLLEQLQSLSSRKKPHGRLSGCVDFFRQRLTTGQRKHDKTALANLPC